MRDPAIDKFGQFLMRHLRDRALDTVETLLEGRSTKAADASLQKQLARLEPLDRNVVRRCVVEATDNAISELLTALDRRAAVEKDIEVRVDGRSLAALGDALHGDEGWIARYSRWRQPRD